MDLFSIDFSVFIEFQNIFAIMFGTVFGLVIGALPGLGPSVGCSLLIPLTYTMEPLPAVLMLIALYQAAEYGGSISAIVLGVPGTAAAVATMLDGNVMAKQGYPGKALGYSLYASTIGGLIGCFVLMFLTVPLTKLTIKFSDPELFLIGIFGLLSVITLGVKDIAKSAISVIFGLFLGTIGLDVFTGVPRYTMGNPYLTDGLSIVSLITGLFAISEVLNMSIGDTSGHYVSDKKNLKTKLSKKELTHILPESIRCSIIGVIFGIIPGLGASPASWASYTGAKRRSKNPESFGKGNPIGIAAPEASNNAVVGGALLPMLTLGIPGSSTIAIVGGALMIQGIQPGPMIFANDPGLVYGIFWGLVIATVVMFIFGRYTTSLWARLLVIPNYVLVVVVLIASLIGAYAIRGMFIDVWITIFTGLIIFFLRQLDYSVSSFVLAFVLAPLIETCFRRSLMISHGSYSVFFTRGWCIAIDILIFAMIAGMIYSQIKINRKQKESQVQE